MKLTVDGGYNQLVALTDSCKRSLRAAFNSEAAKLTAPGHSAVLELGSRRDLSKRSLLKIRVKLSKGTGRLLLSVCH